jgi:hypothetical protein
MGDERNNDKYKKPESYDMSGDELEGVAGGSVGGCGAGQQAPSGCNQGFGPGVPQNCGVGMHATRDCTVGDKALGDCTVGS